MKKFTFNPSKVIIPLGVITLFLILASILGTILRYKFGITTSYFVSLFNLDSEKNIPTFFSTLLLLTCSILLGIIASTRKVQMKREFWHWAILAAGFLFLAADEFIEIHERIGTLVHNKFNTTGVFYFAWIIPYALLAIAVVIAFVPFVWRLPKSVKWMMILAGFLYVFGALGMEAVASYLNYESGERGLYFAVLTTIEETMEMAGLLVFIYALLHYINIELGGMALYVGNQKEDANLNKNDYAFSKAGNTAQGNASTSTTHNRRVSN